MTESDNFVQCVDQTFDRFERYDRYVDVVSAWEEFLDDQYSSEFRDFTFDRFPEESIQYNGSELTPTFTAYFDEDYGILFDVQHNLPRDEEDLKKFLEEISGYDQGYPFRVNGSDTEIPEKYDIALLISNQNAQTAEHRVENFLSKGEVQFDSNLVLLSYDYVDQSTNPKYEFGRLSKVDQNFRDNVLPERKQISTRLSIEDGGFETIDSPPGFFDDKKSTGVLCNKELSELYFACYLWHNVFFNCLDDTEQVIWQGKNPRRIIEFKITVDELYAMLNRKYIPGNGVREEWIRSTLEYLVGVEAAEQVSDDEYRVKFRNLQDKRRDHKDVVTRRSDLADLAHIFAEWYCENAVDTDTSVRSDVRDDSTQTTITSDLTEPEKGEY